MQNGKIIPVNRLQHHVLPALVAPRSITSHLSNKKSIPSSDRRPSTFDLLQNATTWFLAIQGFLAAHEEVVVNSSVEMQLRN